MGDILPMLVIELCNLLMNGKGAEMDDTYANANSKVVTDPSEKEPVGINGATPADTPTIGEKKNTLNIEPWQAGGDQVEANKTPEQPSIDNKAGNGNELGRIVQQETGGGKPFEVFVKEGGVEIQYAAADYDTTKRYINEYFKRDEKDQKLYQKVQVIPNGFKPVYLDPDQIREYYTKMGQPGEVQGTDELKPGWYLMYRVTPMAQQQTTEIETESEKPTEETIN